ncbi:tyrosine-type recombinase/integrase [Mycobacterium vicinigordonae]|nr:site-specific integrase [Mycobacterium vicinigordonae]
MPATKGHRNWGWLRKLPSGKYQASYLKDGTRYKAAGTFDTKLNAEGWLANEKNYLDRCRMTGETWKSPEQRRDEGKAAVLLVGDYGKQVIEERKTKETTRSLYNSLWTNHVQERLGVIPLRELNAEAIRAWYARLEGETTKRHAYSLLNMVCNVAVKDGLLVRNPCQIDGAMTTKRKREPEILTVDELNAVADAMPERFKLLVLLSAWCGLRWGEATELRRSDINANRDQITISRAVTHVGKCRIDTTKSGNVRYVSIPASLRRLVEDHLAEHVESQRDALLFKPFMGGCHVNDQVFAKTWYKPALKDAGREKVRIHDLRHFGATMMAHAGASPTEIALFLGHSTPTMSMRYTAATASRMTHLADRLSKMAETVQKAS